MSDLWRALAASHDLDDRRDRTSGRVPRGHARVDEALSDADALPWREAPAGVRTNVLRAIEASSMARHGAGTPADVWTPVARRVAWSIGGLSMAALVALGVFLVVRPAGTTPREPGPIARTDAPTAPVPTTREAPGAMGPAAMGPVALVRLPERVAPLGEALPAPLLDEAKHLRDDTRRAMDAMFASLPGGWTR
jgi:hypothetical protein